MVPISWMMDLFIIRENFARKGPYRSFVSSRNSLLENYVKVEQVLLTTFWRNFSKHSTRKCVSSNIFPCCSTDLLFRHVVVVQEIQNFSEKWVVLREINTLSFETIALGLEIFRASIVICPVLHTHNNCLEIRTVFRTRVHYYTLTFVHIGSLIRMHFFKGNPILCSSSIVKVLHAWMQMVKMFVYAQFLPHSPPSISV